MLSTKKSWKEWILVLLAFAPLLFINVSASHDWGDDFAQYILQAKCMVEGKPQTTYAIYDSDYYFVLGSPTRPIGLPLLLAPIYYFFGNNMFTFSCLMSVCYYLIALLVFRYLRQTVAFIPALLWACTLLYNPSFLHLKLSVLSDFPFIILLLFFFQVMKKPSSTQQIILLSILTGLLISFRLIGMVLLPVYLLCWITNKPARISFLSFVKQPFLFCALSLAIFVTLNFILFNTTNESWKSYSFISGLIDYSHLIGNLNYYTFIYSLIYEQEVWGFANIILKSFMLIIAGLGFIICLRKKLKAEDWFVIVYLITIFLYPYHSEAIRFLMPVFPMFLFYQIKGLKNIQLPSYKSNNLKIYIIPLIVLLSYKINLQNILHQQGQIQDGPYEKSVASAFDYIKSSLPKNEMYAFTKHYAFMLYADRRCIPSRDNLSLSELKSFSDKYHVKYLLFVAGISGKNILELTQSELHYKLIWQNKRCKIFEWQ